MELAEYLDGKRCTQEELAERMSVSQSLISHYLCKRTRITAERAIQIETATNGEVTRAELRPDLFGEQTRAAAL
jgi:DNA-binding transcriptional regulator YdaS (Cro superfamily)